MVAIHRPHAGSDSFGNVWPEPDSVIDVPAHQAVVLLGIKDAQCTEVDPSRLEAPGKHEAPSGDGAGGEGAGGDAGGAGTGEGGDGAAGDAATPAPTKTTKAAAKTS